MLAALLANHVLLASLNLALLTQRQQVVAFVPLTERSGINHNDGVLYQRLGTDQLVIGRVVHHVDDTTLARHTLRGPGKVSGIETQGTELPVSTASSHEVHTSSTNLGVGGGAA
uniref:Putative secreted mucin n=1 Tax=Anopheles marajoara TaxID=58244 RepID=A0A2M4C7K4_9DIPT